MKVIECPRDAMQGIKEFISTDKKAAYINALLKVGFDTIDFGSFVSPKVIPQMADTVEVLKKLDLSATSSKLLAIVANLRGIEEAVTHPEISYLGFPFSVSETFQLRNTNATIDQSLITVAQAQNLCVKNNKKMVVYISMGFGNPYGDTWNTDIVLKWIEKLAGMDIGILALSDTIGVATPQSISSIFSSVIPAFKNIEFGAHLHTTPNTWKEKVEAAFNSGCYRFDGAIKGFGGCPMAKDDLTGNMPTEHLINYLADKGLKYNKEAFALAVQQATNTFPSLQVH